jgi:glycosyltransferase involved in cell wall biosynthesis
MEFLFWFAAIGATFSYFFYPITLLGISTLKKKEISLSIDNPDSSDSPTTISMIVTAHNEASQIREKIDNTLSLNIDGLTLEIIIASDYSTDETNDIVRSYAERGVKLVETDQHLGKEYAQLCGVKVSQGDIIIFSDAATRLKPEVLPKLLGYFNHKHVGAISSEDRFITKDGAVAGEGYYVKYEMWLRGLESKCAGLIGLSGSFFAARKEVCKNWDILAPSDFNTALNTNKAGMLAVSCTDVEGFYPNIKDETKEYQRKLRTAIRGMTGLARHKEVLNPLKYGLFAYQVWSHKIMRWAVPWFMLLAFVSNISLITNGFYLLTMCLQVLLLSVFFLASTNPNFRQNKLIKLVYFFYQVNMALGHAAIKYISGTRMTTWKPSTR